MGLEDYASQYLGYADAPPPRRIFTPGAFDAATSIADRARLARRGLDRSLQAADDESRIRRFIVDGARDELEMQEMPLRLQELQDRLENAPADRQLRREGYQIRAAESQAAMDKIKADNSPDMLALKRQKLEADRDMARFEVQTAPHLLEMKRNQMNEALEKSRYENRPETRAARQKLLEGNAAKLAAEVELLPEARKLNELSLKSQIDVLKRGAELESMQPTIAADAERVDPTAPDAVERLLEFHGYATSPVTKNAIGVRLGYAKNLKAEREQAISRLLPTHDEPAIRELISGAQAKFVAGDVNAFDVLGAGVSYNDEESRRAAALRPQRDAESAWRDSVKGLRSTLGTASITDAKALLLRMAAKMKEVDSTFDPAAFAEDPLPYLMARTSDEPKIAAQIKRLEEAVTAVSAAESVKKEMDLIKMLERRNAGDARTPAGKTSEKPSADLEAVKKMFGG